MSSPLVLVTGGAGFLGRAIVERCQQRGYKIRIAGRSPRPSDLPPEVEYVQGNLADEKVAQKAVQGCVYIFHVAAKAGIWGKWEDFVAANITATHHLLEAAKANSIRAFVYTSTPSVVFNGESFKGANESLPYGDHWLCAYAETKATAEKIALKASSPQMPVCALRPHLIWGPGDHHLFPRILARARAGKLRIVGDGENLVDVTHVDTAANAHLNALDALLVGRAHGQAYFISQGQPVKLWEFINRLLKGAGIPPATRKMSLRQAYTIGRLCEVLWTLLPLPGEPPMTRFVAVELAKDHYFDTTAAQRDLGLRPAHETWSALDALAATFRQKK